jgi:hypothetical protein
MRFLACQLCVYALLTVAASAQCVSGQGATNFNSQGLDGGTAQVARDCASAPPQRYLGGVSSDTLAFCSRGCIDPESQWGFHQTLCYIGDQECKPGTRDSLGNTPEMAIKAGDDILWSCYNKFPKLASFLRQNGWIHSKTVHYLLATQLGDMGVRVCESGKSPLYSIYRR